jgi:neutral ceramidase
MPLRAGSFRTDITPAIGCSLQGSFEDIRSTEIHDPLYANALVLDDGTTEVALVSVDTCELHEHNVRAIAAEIQRACAIPAEHVILAASHTHNGPPTGALIVESVVPDPVYVEHFRRQVVSAVQMAQKRKQPVRLGVGQAENLNHVFNRRLRKPGGGIIMNWLPAEYLAGAQPGGPVDPQMSAIRLVTPQGQTVAFILNYANHNNAAGGTRISADISGHMGDLLRKIYGPELVVVFLLGACGNVNWVDWRNPERWAPHHFQDIATGLTGTVLQIAAVMDYPPVETISVSHQALPIPERPYRDIDTRPDGTFGGDDDLFIGVYRAARAAAEGQPLPVHTLDLALLRLGADVAIVTNPNELFCDFGLAIKAGSPVKYTLVSELTNGALGYVPTPQAFEEGGYEIRKLPGNSFLALDAGERIVEASLALLRGPASSLLPST